MTQAFNIKRAANCLSDLRIDAYFADELGADELRALQEHAAACTRCAAMLREREEERTAYLGSAPAVALRSELRRRAPPRRARGVFWGAAASLSIAAAVLFLILPQTGIPLYDSGTRTKGAPHLGFFVKHGQQVRRGSDGVHVQPGDLLRFTYNTERSLYLTILSFDAAGHASEYFPQSRVVAGRHVALPSSVELDATLGLERIYGLFCQKPVTVPMLLTALENSAGKLTPPAACTLDTLRIIKEPKH